MMIETHDSGSGPSTGRSWLDRCAGLTPSSRRSFLRFTRWQFLWAVSLATVAFTREFDLRVEWAGRDGVALVLAAIPLLLASLTLWAYMRFVRSADELTQKIQAEALRLAVALGLLYLSVHPLAERLGASRPEFPTPVLFILIGHFVGETFAARRYR